jgi:hypothetical protein
VIDGGAVKSVGADVGGPLAGVVTTKFIVVGLTYVMTPRRVPPAVVSAPVVVFVNPVPVKVTTVPLGAPAARPAGVCDVMTGPATETAAGKALLPAPVLLTTTLSGPEVAPVAATETLKVTAVPELPEGLLSVTPVAAVAEVPTKAAAVEN